MNSWTWLFIICLAEAFAIAFLIALRHDDHVSWSWLRERMEAADWEAIDFWRTRDHDGCDLDAGKFNSPPLSLYFDMLKAGYDFDRDPRLT